MSERGTGTEEADTGAATRPGAAASGRAGSAAAGDAAMPATGPAGSGRVEGRVPSAATVAFGEALALVGRRRPTGTAAAQAPAFAPGPPGGAGSGSGALVSEVGRPGPVASPSPLGGGLIAGVRRQLEAGQLSAVELVEQALLAAEKTGRALGAIVELFDEAALAEAARLDRLAAGAGADTARRGPLHGIPITVKDVIHMAGVPTRAGSAAYCVVPDRDAVALARARQAGAIVVAKVATHEFALGVTTPQCANPYDDRRIPGGSSGGSAIAVACGIGMASIGTDTRASIRVPAALCGVVGFKGTYGLVPTEGIVPLSWTMDHVAPMAATVADAALVLEVMAGRALRRSTNGGRGGPRAPTGRTANPHPAHTGHGGLRWPEGSPGSTAGAGRPWRVGVALAGFDGCEPSISSTARNAIDALVAALGRGAYIVEADRPDAGDFDLSNAAGLVISRCEAAAFHRSLGADRTRYWAEVADQLDAADAVTAADYLDAQRLRAQVANDLLGVFDHCDVLCMPTVGVGPPLRDDFGRYLTVLSRACIPWSLVGFPAASVPCGRDRDGFPVGLQIVGAPGADGTVADAGICLERAVAPVSS